MFPNVLLNKVVHFTTQLPTGVAPNFKHWKTCQLPLVQVSKEWRKTLIPTVFNEAHIVYQHHDENASTSLKPGIEGTFESKISCSSTEKHWQEYLTTRLVVKISTSKDAAAAIKAIVKHVEPNRLYLRKVLHLVLDIETRGNANDGWWIPFKNCEESNKMAHMLAGMLPYVCKLTIRLDSSNADVSEFVTTFTRLVGKQLAAFDFKANGWMQNLLYAKFQLFTRRKVEANTTDTC